MFLFLYLFLCLNVRKQKKIDCPPKNENVPHNCSQGKLSPSDQILAQTLTKQNKCKASIEINSRHNR